MDFEESLVADALKQNPHRSSLTACNNGIEYLPAAIAQFTKLKRLTLYDNALQELPDEIGELQCLEALNLRFNRIVRLPEAIGLLGSLKELNLDGNRIESLPRQVAQLRSLVKLDLRNNQLLALPAQIGQLSKLRNLWLSGNQLTSLPNQIGGLTELREFWCEDNALTALPAEFVQLKQLERVGLSGNPMKAPPIECCDHGVCSIMTHLTELSLGFYPLPSTKPGYALVIANSSYGLEACEHNGKAVAALLASFRFALYKGQVHENLSAEQVTALCSELAGEDHGQAGACVVYITGCGDNRGVLEGVDGGTVAISTLTEAFDAEGCPGLLHKPKLFIADLCAREHSELAPTAPKLSLPCDFLYSLAICPGMHCFVGGPNNMSWWSYLLTRALKGPDTQGHLVEVLQQVSHQFALQVPSVVQLQMKPSLQSFLRMNLSLGQPEPTEEQQQRARSRAGTAN